MTKPKFATPGQRQMWLDAIMNIEIQDLPSEYDSEDWEDVPGEEDTFSDEELEGVYDEGDLDLEEETEELEEISKKTLGSYIKKASHDVATKSAAVGRYADRANKVKDETKAGDYSNWQQGKKDEKTADKFFDKSWKRRKGIEKAVDKLTNEEIITEGVAEEILAQLGGNKFYAMTGAKPWTKGNDHILFKLPKNKSKATRLKITLNGKDLYDLEFAAQPKLDYKILKTFTDIEVSNLKKVFTDYTGLLTSLREDTEEPETEAPDYTYDPDLSSIAFQRDGYTVHGLYNVEYEDLFYKIWIEKDGKSVYSNDYGKEKMDLDSISDDQVDDYLDTVVNYAMKADSKLHESFEFVEEIIVEKTEEAEIVTEDFTNITLLQNLKSNKVTLTLKNGDKIDVASDEAKIIAKRFGELKGDLQKKFGEMLDKSQTAFLIAYKDAMK